MLRRIYTLAVLATLAAAAAAAGTDARPDSASVKAGAKLFAQYCQTCHGKTGLGDGPGAAGLKPKPRNLHDAKQLKSRSDEDLFKVVSKGGPALGLSPLMVGWGSVLKEPQIRQVVAYVRSLADTAGARRKAK